MFTDLLSNSFNLSARPFVRLDLISSSMKRTIVFIAFLVSSISSFGQQVPKEEMRNFMAKASERRIKGDTVLPSLIKQPSESTVPSGIVGILAKVKDLRNKKPPSKPAGGDTLIIGIPPLDSLTITGSFTHTGPVFVLGNGILRFKNANATIIGDLYVWGEHALVTADSSYLYFPQQYFYQRSLVLAGKGTVIYRNTTLDHSGLSNNLALTDTSRIELDNVTNIGFTTCVMYTASEYNVNGINQAGEFVIVDHARLNFRHAKTILLWYQVPDAAVFHYAFPSGDTVQSYALNNTTPGISGINYSVNVDTCTDIMWALMPATGSDISITNSKIRSIGLWFLGHDTINVSGLVGNSTYTDYTANLSDRNLRLINSSVQTWSLYPMDTSNLNVTGCILGEIGSQANSRLIATDAFVDGSGGYWSSNGQALILADNCMAVNAVRSTQNAFFIFAYCTLNQGEAAAMGNSILMIIQSELPALPTLYDGSCVWYTRVEGPTSGLVDTIVPVFGSAWIKKTPSSHLMDFACYQMYWQKSGDTVWNPIGSKSYTEKHDEILANWNTQGFSPGLYYLKLVITDNTVDSNQNEAIQAINLLPRIFGIHQIPSSELSFRIYPDPVNENSVARFNLPAEDKLQISITDISGKLINQTERQFRKGGNMFNIGKLNLSKGSYTCVLKNSNWFCVQKFVKY